MSIRRPQETATCDYCNRLCVTDVPLSTDGLLHQSEWDKHSMFESELYALVQNLRGLCIADDDLAALCDKLRDQLYELARTYKSYGVTYKCYDEDKQVKEKKT